MKRFFAVLVALAVLGTMMVTAQVFVMADDLTTGLVAHYDFSNLSNGVVEDITGNGYDGTYQNATSVQGKLDGAVSITGSADGAWYDNTEKSRVLLPAGAFATADDITIAMLIKPDFTGIDSNNLAVMTSGKAWDTQDTFINFWLNHDNGGGVGPHMAIQPTSGDRSHLRTADVRVAENEWTWLVYTHTNGVGTFYLNGTQVSSGNVAASFKGLVEQGAGDICIGASVIFPGDDGFGGLVDEVLIYGRAITADEVNGLEDALAEAKADDGNEDEGNGEGNGEGNEGEGEGNGEGNEGEGEGEQTPSIPTLDETDKDVLFYTDFSDVSGLVVKEASKASADAATVDAQFDEEGNLVLTRDQYVDLGIGLLEDQEEIIIEFVVKPDAIVEHAAFAGIGVGDDAGWIVMGMRGDGAVKFGSKSNDIEVGALDAGRTDGGLLVANEWVTVKYQITATTATVYVNGTEVKTWDLTGQKTLAEIAELEGAQFAFGKETKWGDAGFSGTVSEIRVTTSATASSDVSDPSDEPTQTGDIASVAAILLAGVAAFGGLKLRKK